MKLLNESKRDNLLQPFVDLYNSKVGGNMTISQMKQVILKKLVNEAGIRNLSLVSNYYLAGAARYYFNGDLTTNKELGIFNNTPDTFNNEICERLNVLILILRNAYIDSVGTKFEQPEDFGTMTIGKLLRKYNKAINSELSSGNEEEKEPGAINTDNHIGNGYTFDIICSQKEASKYYQYTQPGAWCITYSEQYYDYYIRTRHVHYVIFLKDGYQNVPRRKGPNWTRFKPQDEYGNSMIALLQKNSNGEPDYITSRWNHGDYSDGSKCEADHAYTKEEFLNVVGITNDDLKRIQELWQKKTGELTAAEKRKAKNSEKTRILRKFKYAQMRINGGDKDPFDGAKMNNAEPLTGVERFLNYNKIWREKYSNAASDEEKREIFAQYEDGWKKMAKNYIAARSVELSEGTFFFLMDKDKILFETIVKRMGGEKVGDHFKSSEKSKALSSNDSISLLNNIVECKVENGLTMLYDTRYHRFVTVGNKNKFKETSIKYSAPSGKDCVFYQVMVSQRQRALVDIKTNEPLRLPNGEYWFEYFRTNLSNDTYVLSSDVVIDILYEMATNERYFYNVSKRRFFDIDGDASICSVYQGAKEDYNGIYVVRKLNEDNREGYYLYKEEEPLSINPQNGFSDVNAAPNGSFATVELFDSGRVYLIDLNTEKSYSIPTDHPIFYSDFDYNSRFVRFVIAPSRKIILFSIQFKEFIKNPFDGTYLMPNTCFYRSGYYVINGPDGQQYKVSENSPTLEPIKREVYERNQYNSPIKIDVDDIRNMVTECIMKIKNKHIN